jgi:2-iminobutanoate/2-iminopropanoate deaminase
VIPISFGKGQVMTEKDILLISTHLAPTPGGHYAQAIQYDNLLFVSGQLPMYRDGTHLSTAPFETQCRQALTNLFAVLAGAGSSPDRVLKITAYIAAAAHWGAFNVVFAEMFGAHRPARSVVPVNELHYGYLVEIDAIAAVQSAGTSPS